MLKAKGEENQTSQYTTVPYRGFFDFGKHTSTTDDFQIIPKG